jgi:hypothetical protein
MLAGNFPMEIPRMLSGLLLFVDDAAPMFLGVCVAIACIFFYFLPGIVASSRKVANGFAGIILLNIFLGWTVIGWLGALIWACTAETKAQAQLREMAFAQMASGYAQPPTGYAPPTAPEPSAAPQAGRAAGAAMRGTSPRNVILAVFAILLALGVAATVANHFLFGELQAAPVHPVSAH